MRRLRLALAAAAAWLAAASVARGYDVEVDAETVGQGYQLATAGGAIVNRQRLTQYLGLHVWNLGPKDALGQPRARNQVYFTSSMRFETDFGDFARTRLGDRNVADELRTSRFELLYAYGGVRDLGGLVDLKLGRQVDVDTLQFLSYDGLSAEVKTPYYISLQGYGGVLVNGAMPFDSPLYRTDFASPIYRPDGTSPSAISVHDRDWKPTLGVVLRTFGLRDLDARLSYRRTFSPGQHTTDAERRTGAIDGTTEEKLAFSGRARLADGLVVPWFAVRYDALVGAVDTVQAGARLTLTDRHALQAEYYYSLPTFDGDSIWNLFVRSRFDDVRAGWDGRFGPLRAYARAFLRLFHDDDEAVDRHDPRNRKPRPPGTPFDGGGNLGARLDLARGFVRADGYADAGYGGEKIGFDVASRMRIWREMLFLEGRATYVYFRDDHRPLYGTGHSFGLQLGARFHLGRGIVLHVIAEENVNRIYATQLRLYAVLDLSFLLGSGGFSQGYPRGVGAALGAFGSPLGGAY